MPISEFKSKAAETIARLGRSDEPVVVTQNGRPTAVLLSPKAYDALTYRQHFVAAIDEGLADVEAGRVISHADLKKWLKSRKKSGR